MTTVEVSMDLLKMTRKFGRNAIDAFQAAIETVNTESEFFKGEWFFGSV
jgi:hypothetical protein